MKNAPRVLAIALPALIIGAASLLTGCGSKTSSDSTTASSAAAGTDASSAESVASTTPLGTQLFADNFTSVCQGVGLSRAQPYVAAGPHKALYIQTYRDHLQDDSQELPADWTVQFDPKSDAYAAIDVVGCSSRTTTAFLKECTGYQSKGKDTGNKVRLYSASYDVTVREAQTGKVLGSTVLASTSTDCPMFQSFAKDETSVDVYQTPSKDEIVAFLTPFVQP